MAASCVAENTSGSNLFICTGEFANMTPPMSRTVNKILKPIKRRVKYGLARGYRHAIDKLGNICFIGITGSCGKTTTTELIAAILAKEGQVRKCSHVNATDAVIDTIMTVSPRHRFCIQELSAGYPGLIAKTVKLLRPQIGVITNIGQDHYTVYRTPEATARDKVKLIEALPPEGTAVLNIDDAIVFEMRNRTKAKVITYGFSAEAIVRGENVSSIWPERMSLDICFDGKQIHVQTKLLGEHWAHAVLAAIATGIAVGIPLERDVGAVESFEPTPYRMCPHVTPDGVTFVSDNWKSPLWTVPASLDFMRKAKAQRKIAVIGTISDTPKGFYHRYKAVATQALNAVEKVIFVGEHALTALRARQNPDDQRIMAFCTLVQLNTFLNGYLKQGDLVLLKGTENVDHLQRIIISRTHISKQSDICWREKCDKKRYCEDCRHLLVPGKIEGNNQTI
jgi:UDP-N-acetylmuramoyl-tripeptide--D-alanyl-D-alanine ligase